MRTPPDAQKAPADAARLLSFAGRKGRNDRVLHQDYLERLRVKLQAIKLPVKTDPLQPMVKPSAFAIEEKVFFVYFYFSGRLAGGEHGCVPHDRDVYVGMT